MSELSGFQKFIGFSLHKRLGNHLGQSVIEWLGSAGTFPAITNADTLLGQTFTTGAKPLLIKSVSCRVSRTASGSPGKVFLSIRETESSLPVGNDLVVTSVEGTDIPSSGVMYKINLPPLVLKANTEYAWMFRAPEAGPVPNELSILGRGSGTTDYPGGQAVTSLDGGDTWSFQGAARDFFFKVEGLDLPDDPLDVFGIYQRRKTKTRGRRSIRVNFYIQTNPQTSAQQANRSKMTAAVSAWQGLSEAEKIFYNIKARRSSRTGYHYFLSLHLKGLI